MNIFDKLKRLSLAFAAFPIAGLLPNELSASKCIDYKGFWVLERENSVRKNFRETFFSADMSVETRGYYEIFSRKEVYIEHVAGRLKDSLDKCHEILDTARQQDQDGNPAGRISTGYWYALPTIIRNEQGLIVMREIFEDQGKFDTVDMRYVSESPAFRNKAILSTTRIAAQSKRIHGQSLALFQGFQINGRRRIESGASQTQWEGR